MPDPRLDNGEGIDEEEEDEEVSDNPLPAWLEGDSLAPPCQADMDVVRAIIDFAGVTEDDVLYDLGCGDGRICIEAAESRGAKACGVEIEEDLADKFRRRVAAKGLESKVSVVHGDLRDVDLSDATVLVMYLLPEAMGDIAQSHLLPFLRRGRSPPSQEKTPFPEDEKTLQHSNSPPRGKTSLAGDEDTSRRSDSPPQQKTSVPVDEETPQHSDSPPRGIVPLAGDEETSHRSTGISGGEESPHHCDGSVVLSGGDLEGGRGDRGRVSGEKPFRIVCNTWGIPGAIAVREAGVGMYGGVKLRLFTHESLPPEDTA